MVLTIGSETDLEALMELVADAAFQEGVFHLVHGELVFTGEVLRAVPDKAEEYWMGPMHRTRIPWTKCLMEFIGITRCQVKECEEASGEPTPLLTWEKQGGHYVIGLRTPQRMELILTLPQLSGRCEDVGQLIWQR